jgi:hypothetical protein
MEMSRGLAGLLAAALLPGCATVTRGTSEAFAIHSQPPGAEVSMTNGASCVTPCALKLKRKTGFVATITKPGYKPAQVTVASAMHSGGTATVAGSALTGGVIGLLVDRGNGALKDLRPNPIEVTLTPESAAGPIVIPAAAAPVWRPRPILDPAA